MQVTRERRVREAGRSRRTRRTSGRGAVCCAAPRSHGRHPPRLQTRPERVGRGCPAPPRRCAPPPPSARTGRRRPPSGGRPPPRRRAPSRPRAAPASMETMDRLSQERVDLRRVAPGDRLIHHRDGRLHLSSRLEPGVRRALARAMDAHHGLEEPSVSDLAGLLAGLAGGAGLGEGLLDLGFAVGRNPGEDQVQLAGVERGARGDDHRPIERVAVCAREGRESRAEGRAAAASSCSRLVTSGLGGAPSRCTRRTACSAGVLAAVSAACARRALGDRRRTWRNHAGVGQPRARPGRGRLLDAESGGEHVLVRRLRRRGRTPWNDSELGEPLHALGRRRVRELLRGEDARDAGVSADDRHPLAEERPSRSTRSRPCGGNRSKTAPRRARWPRGRSPPCREVAEERGVGDPDLARDRERSEAAEPVIGDHAQRRVRDLAPPVVGGLPLGGTCSSRSSCASRCK